jgi:hypothetical protein
MAKTSQEKYRSINLLNDVCGSKSAFGRDFGHLVVNLWQHVHMELPLGG